MPSAPIRSACRLCVAARALHLEAFVRLVIHIAKSVLQLLKGPGTTPSALSVPIPVTSSAVRALRPPPGRRSRRFQ